MAIELGDAAETRIIEATMVCHRTWLAMEVHAVRRFSWSQSHAPAWTPYDTELRRFQAHITLGHFRREPDEVELKPLLTRLNRDLSQSLRFVENSYVYLHVHFCDDNIAETAAHIYMCSILEPPLSGIMPVIREMQAVAGDFFQKDAGSSISFDEHERLHLSLKRLSARRRPSGHL